MTQSTMRIHHTAMPATKSTGSKPKAKPAQSQANVKPSMSVKSHDHADDAKPQANTQTANAKANAKGGAGTNSNAKQGDTAKASTKHDQKKSQPRSADTPSDVIANAASEAKSDQGVYASMKRAMSPYVEHHSHAVLYGILGFIAAALILIVGFWPTVLLAVFAAIGVIIGRYRDGDRKTRMQMKQLLNRFNQ